MSIHSGGNVWAGLCMEQAEGELSKLAHGSGNMANDEGTNINWGFVLREGITYEELRNMAWKLGEEMETHPEKDRIKEEAEKTNSY